MKTANHYSLVTKNSFSVTSTCEKIFFPASLADLNELPDLSLQPFYILGEGSNTLFTSKNCAWIICPDFTGINIEETEQVYRITVGASENWHQLVCFCLDKDMLGLENLALIPGSVGAAPVQNIGAYGVEFGDFCTSVTWYDFKQKKLLQLNTEQCEFGYRDSIFKQALYNKGIITEVTLTLPKTWRGNMSYQGLNVLPKNATAKQIMAQVVSLRQNKLPDPKQLPNAGSFFKNPIVSQQQLTALLDDFGEMPFYRQSNDEIKLAAGWLIEQAGLKGYRDNQVGVHQNQALVLVNYGSDDGNDIVGLAKYVQTKVVNKFGIKLTPEVRMITINGEVPFDQLANLTKFNEKEFKR